MRALIVKVSALGDIVHALPVLSYLQMVSPGIEVDWVVEEQFRELLEGHPQLARLHTVRVKVWRKSPFSASTRREVEAVRQALLERNYDLVFDVQGNIKSGVIAWLSGGKKRYGFSRDDARESLNTLFTHQQIPLRRQDHHVTDRSLRVVSVPFGKDYSTYPVESGIFTSDEDDLTAATYLATLSDGLVFLFHHGTTWVTKLWHEAGWIELGQKLLDAFPDSSILLSWGGDAERIAAERIARGIGHGVRLLPRLSLKGFAALLKKVDLAVGGDTGPIHIAAAVGTPTVSFYRATDGQRNGPRGEQHRIVQSPMHCSRCLKKRV